MFDKYEASLSIRNYAPSSLRKNIQLAKRFVFDSGTQIHEISVCNVEEYLLHLREKGRSAKTIKNHRSAIKVFCDYLAREGILQGNPVAHIPSMELPTDVPVFLPDDEVDLLHDLARCENFDCEVTVALCTGLRVSELRNLKWTDVDFDQRQLLVRESKGKRPRMVPLNARAREALISWISLHHKPPLPVYLVHGLILIL